jgi:hypothetical protein
LICFRFLTSATRDLFQGARVYDLDNPGLGDEFIEAIEHAVALLRQNLEMAQTFEKSRYRCFPVDRFP